MDSLVCEITLNSVLPSELRAKYQDPDTIRMVLRRARTIAIVGLSTDRYKASNMVAAYLQYEGYRVIPINPSATEILGERCYPDLLSVPYPIDVVDVFRPAREAVGIVEQAIQKGAWGVWFQLRIVNLQAAELAEKSGLTVVIDRCIKMEHGRYGGGLHWLGMNTEIISARRMRRMF